MSQPSHRREPDDGPRPAALIVAFVALAVSVFVLLQSPGMPFGPPIGDAPTTGVQMPVSPLAPVSVGFSASDLCLGLLNSPVINFMGDSVGTPDSFDVGCAYRGDHHTTLGLLWFPGTQQFGTDLAIARADFGSARVIHNRADAAEIYYAGATLPNGDHNLVVEWTANCGDFQLKIAWHGKNNPMSPLALVGSLNYAFFGQTGPIITQLAGTPLTAGAGPRPSESNQ